MSQAMVYVTALVLGLSACGDGGPKVTGPKDGTEVDQTTAALPADSALAAVVHAAATARGLSADSAGLASLTELNAAGRGIASLEGMAVLQGLQTLDLSKNQIADLIPLAALDSLRVLNLAGNRIADLTALAGLGSLRVLDLSANKITDLTPLVTLQRLEVLLLQGNLVAEVTPLLALTSLKEVELSGNPLNSEARQAQVESLRSRGVRVTAGPTTEETEPSALTLAYHDWDTGICLLDYPGGVPRTLPVPAIQGDYGGYSWAPDGRSLVVSVKLAEDLVYRLYLVSRDGSSVRPLAQQAPVWSQSSPRWSPAGDRIALAQATNQITFRLALADTATGAVTLTPFGAAQQIWSPDGRSMAYGDSGQLRLIDLEGMTEAVACIAPYAGDLGWSPDGSMIVFTAKPVDEQNLDVYLWHVGDTEAIRLSEDRTDSVRHGGPVWAPDGTAIAYLAERWNMGAKNWKDWSMECAEVRVQRPDGSLVQVIDLTPRRPMELTWSPDGTVIALAARIPEEGKSTIYAVDPATGTLEDLFPSAHATSYDALSWAPR